VDEPRFRAVNASWPISLSLSRLISTLVVRESPVVMGIAEVVMATVGTWDLGRTKMSCHLVLERKKEQKNIKKELKNNI
jgi:hypothetical protein